MPNGCNVLALVIKWASRAFPFLSFFFESRLLRMSSMGIRRTSLMEWPAWLKCSDTGVVVLSCWWFRIERRFSPKRSLSWRFVSPMYWWWHFLHSIRYMRFFEWQLGRQALLLLPHSFQMFLQQFLTGHLLVVFPRFSWSATTISLSLKHVWGHDIVLGWL